MAHIVTWNTTNIGKVEYSRSSSGTTVDHAYVTNDYVDVIEVGPKTNVLVDALDTVLDDSTQYFFGIRMRAFATYTEDEGSRTMTGAEKATATSLDSYVHTYGGGGDYFGLGELLESLPTTGFLRPPSDIVIPVGRYSRASTSDFRYFSTGGTSADAISVIPRQDGVIVANSSASINLAMNTPESTVRITMPLLYVPQAFQLSNYTWLWCYPMIYNAQGVPYGS